VETAKTPKLREANKIQEKIERARRKTQKIVNRSGCTDIWLCTKGRYLFYGKTSVASPSMLAFPKTMDTSPPLRDHAKVSEPVASFQPTPFSIELPPDLIPTVFPQGTAIEFVFGERTLHPVEASISASRNYPQKLSSTASSRSESSLNATK
jgi:hypothetical protein